MYGNKTNLFHVSINIVFNKCKYFKIYCYTIDPVGKTMITLQFIPILVPKE